MAAYPLSRSHKIVSIFHKVIQKKLGFGILFQMPDTSIMPGIVQLMGGIDIGRKLLKTGLKRVFSFSNCWQKLIKTL